MSVFVLDRHGKPLMPCTEKRARLLLQRGRARVHRMMPFAIRIVDRVTATSELQPLRLKLDPGSKFTGMALVRDVSAGAAVVALFELGHRGGQISLALAARRLSRRARRNRKTRYRAARFLNRKKGKGWLPPSLRHRIVTVMAWVRRIGNAAPISAISTELVRFDTQAMQNPEITGVEYRRGTLAGYEVKEYLLEKWGRKCIYCDAQKVPLQIEHIEARANGGSNRVSNLGLSCEPCNQKKSARLIAEFLKKDPKRLARIVMHAKQPLRDAAAVNSTRLALLKELQATGLPVESSTGGRTKYNRTRLGIPKTHALDAACVGKVDSLTGWARPTMLIKATGRGEYRRTQVNKFGFPRVYRTRIKRPHGFQTGDIASGITSRGKFVGSHKGRVIARADGCLYINKIPVMARNCKLIQRADGYSYSYKMEEK